MIKNLIVFTGIAALMLGLVYWGTNQGKKKTLPYYQFDPESQVINKYGSPLREFHRVGYWSFTNHRGNVYNQDSLAGKIYIADYFFISCPGICKQMGAEMKRLYDTFKDKKEVVFLSHTSKPEEDSISALAAYARSKQVNDERWVFLTGDNKELYRVARDQYFIVNFDDQEDDFVHTERFVLVDSDRYIRGYYDGTDKASVDTLIQHIQLLLSQKLSTP